MTDNRRTDADPLRNQNEPDRGDGIPGDADAADIVGRTGEEMPEVAHDEGAAGNMSPDELADFEEGIVQGEARPTSKVPPVASPD